MTEETMPAAEAEVVAEDQNSYELAFHVLPTVAEGEVPDVFAAIKTSITEHGGAIFDEEAPQRFDLAYDIIQNNEGKNRHFSSAYFGWVRATLPSEAVAALTEDMDDNEHVLRHLLIKLTKLEVENPIRFHEIMAELDEKVSTITEDEVTAVVAEAPSEEAPATETNEAAEADTAEAAEADVATADTATEDTADEATPAATDTNSDADADDASKKA